MADFAPAFAALMRFEKWRQTNHPNDLGGLTYAGISKRYHPKWPGWSDIFAAERARGGRPGKTLYNLVIDFYRREFWRPMLCPEVIDQNLATSLLIAAVLMHPTHAAKCLQRALNQCWSGRGPDAPAPLKIDGKLGEKTGKTLDEWTARSKDATFALICAFKVERGLHYIRVVDRKPAQLTHLKGWQRRALTS